MDPSQPGNYNYKCQDKEIEVNYKPIYIGNSSAYESNRWKHHLYESSHNNIKNKKEKMKEMIKNNNLSNEDYLNNFVILVYLNRDLDTELERYLIMYYGLDNLLNHDKGGVILTCGSNMYDNIKVWDFETNSLCNTVNAVNFCIENGIHHITSLADNILTKQRFCLLENKEIAQITYDKYIKLIKLYKIENKEIVCESHTYNEWSDMGIDMYALTTNRQDVSYRWYINKAILERKLTSITLYKGDTPKTLLYMEWTELDSRYKYVIDGVQKSFNGYSISSLDPNSILNKFELLTLYKENIKLIDNIESKTLTKEEWMELEYENNRGIYNVLKGSSLSANGWYINKDELTRQITPWTLYYKKENIVMSETLKYYEWIKKIRGISRLINKKSLTYKGYALSPENVPKHYNKETKNIIYKDNKVLTYKFDATKLCTTFEYMDNDDIKSKVKQNHDYKSSSKALYEGKINSIDGLYICRDSYSYMYMCYVIYNKKTQETICDFYINLQKIVGKNFSQLIIGNRKIANGWSTYPHV